MRLPNSAHTSQPWRIHELTPDFTLEDVWALPTPGGREEFARLVAAFFAGDFPRDAPPLVGLLWAARLRIGSLLGWDDPADGLDFRVPRCATGCRRTCTPHRPIQGSTSGPSPHLRAGRRVGGRTGQPNRARRPPSRLGSRRKGQLSRPACRAGQTERASRCRVLGRDQAISLPGRLPGPAPRARTPLALPGVRLRSPPKPVCAPRSRTGGAGRRRRRARERPLRRCGRSTQISSTRSLARAYSSSRTMAATTSSRSSARTTSASPPSRSARANHRHVILAEAAIGGHDTKLLGLRLGDQQAVERVSVMKR